jgi:hypothetical protein
MASSIDSPPPFNLPTSGPYPPFFDGYDAGGFFDEMFDADGSVRNHYRKLLHN